MVMVGVKDNEGTHIYDIETNYGLPYGDNLLDIRRRIECASLLIGFNLKFDLHWIKRYVPDIKFPPCYDVQLGFFVLGNQQHKFPSLNEVSIHYGFGPKLDVVKLEYWDHDIDTQDVPRDILADYLNTDLDLTQKCCRRQLRDLRSDPRKQLLKLQMEDLLILQEMEWNGLLYNLKEAGRRGDETRERLGKITQGLSDLSPAECIDWGSDDHVSCVLYGGSIYEAYRYQYERELKNGTKVKRERWETRPIAFPRLVRPLPRSETLPTKGMVDDDLERLNNQRVLDGKRPFVRHYSCSEPTLRRLKNTNKKATRIIGLLLERSEIKKLLSTYYDGMRNLYEKMEWDTDMMHGQFNQCAVVTGRLSSSNPNLQNFDAVTKELFYSRHV